VSHIDVKLLKKTMISAGQLARSMRSKIVIVDESDRSNVTTNVDVAINDYLLENLTKVLAIPMVSEESYSESVVPPFDPYWIIDPIDGTLSFLNGFDGYVTQVALISQGLPIVAIVYAPETNELYFAESGLGASKNDKEIKVSANPWPQSVIDNYPVPNRFVEGVMSHFGIRNYRESGSLGLKICRVAEGNADLFVKQTRVHDWDIAPGALILHEAGGFYSLLNGDEYNFQGKIKKENFLAINRLHSLPKL
jgi:3'(2'), 5'-bisphosphate nucleotidase